MERDALLVYLEELRNLETIKHYLGNTLHQLGNAQLEQTILLRKKEESKVSGRTKASVIAFFVLMAIGVAIFALTEYNWGLFQYLLHYFVPLFFVILAVVIFGSSFSDISHTKKLNKEVRAYNQEVDARTPTVKAELEKLETADKYYTGELRKVELLLTEAYSFNQIPMPFRNLESIIYIYDYMTTSDASLQETLYHTHMEEGIQRIVARLDKIISQNMQMISLLKMQIAQNAALSQQLSSIAADTKMAAHYSKVNSYILTANYLKT